MQRKYIRDLLAKHNMLDAKSVSTPLPESPKLTIHAGDPLPDGSKYRSVVGSLQYLAFTRPDISYAVNRLAQFMHKPTSDHWQAAKRVLRYLAGTQTHGVFLHKASPLQLHAYSDADWAGDTDDYVSTNAYVVYIPSPGHPRSNKVLLVRQRKLNTDRLRLRHLKSDGYVPYSLNYIFHYLLFQPYIAIIWEPHIFALIQCFIPV